MSWIESARRTARRVDLQVAWALAALFTPLVAIVLATLYAFAADELLELVDESARSRLEELARVVESADDAIGTAAVTRFAQELSDQDASFSVLDASGRSIVRGGVQPRPRLTRRESDIWLAAVRLSARDHLLYERRLPDGRRLQLTLGMTSFARERDDIQRGFWVSLALGVVLVAGMSLPATRRALRPLRRATQATERINLQRLAARLPVRGTRDDVDRHAAAVNRVLDHLEAGFERIQGFSHDIAHELRTPVNRVLNVAEVALMEGDGGDRSRDALESIRDSVDQMRRLIDGLLLLAESGEGGLKLEGRRIRIADLLRTLAELYGPVCEERGVRLEVRSLAASVQGDPALLMRALGNLLDNALAHTPRGGAISLDGSRGKDSIMISVSDSGPGIPAAERERVFGRFVRLDPARCGSGTGLGLPIARAVARAHGGDLQVDESESQGARLSLHLPLSDEVATGSPASSLSNP